MISAVVWPKKVGNTATLMLQLFLETQWHLIFSAMKILFKLNFSHSCLMHSSPYMKLWAKSYELDYRLVFRAPIWRMHDEHMERDLTSSTDPAHSSCENKMCATQSLTLNFISTLLSNDLLKIFLMFKKKKTVSQKFFWTFSMSSVQAESGS